MSLPHLRNDGLDTVLFVDDRPFVMLAGEVHNSSGSSLRLMERAWEKADRLGLNTLLVAVTWELVEPEEGHFDFSGVDALISQAQTHGGRLALLWFGAWKNAQCYYAPEWVKRNLARFRRAEVVAGERRMALPQVHGMSYSTLSAFCDETRIADARAFAQIMVHLREHDPSHVVIAVQVENECGLLGAARDHCLEADEAYIQEVPNGLVAHLLAHPDQSSSDILEAVQSGARKGSWEEVFGPVAEEAFQTYHTARYVNFVAAAGKSELALPTFCNCWLDKGNEPGRYPTGGPTARVHGIWRFAAPHVDVLAPDIYVRTFCDVCDAFHRPGNPLLIPETATHSYMASRAMWVVGHHHALGISPFGFESMGEPFTAMEGALFGMDVTDPALGTPQDPDEYGATMRALATLIEHAGGTARMDAVVSERGLEQVIELGNWHLVARFEEHVPGAVLVLPVTDDEAYVLVRNVTIEALSNEVTRPHLDLLAVEDGSFVDGVWVRDRRLNGDEVTVMRYSWPTLLKMRVMTYA